MPRSIRGTAVDEPGDVDATKRIDRADELLARLIDDIGTGPALDRLRKDAQRIKHVLRGLDW